MKKCAFFINTPIYPLIQVYEKSGRKYGISTIAFIFLGGACGWLGLDAALISSHLERIKQARPASPPDT